MSSLRIQRIRTFEDLDAIKDIWTAFESENKNLSLFQSWIWNRTWCDYVLSSRKRARLDVRLLEEGAGHPVAILPFFEESIAGPMLSLVQFLGHQASPHNDILLIEPQNPELAASVALALRKDLGPRNLLHLRHLDGKSTFAQHLLSQGIAEQHCTYVWLQEDLANPYKRMSRITRKRFRNKLNKLRREFEVEFAVRSGADFAMAFDELLDLHFHRFATKGASTFLVGPTLDFLRNVTAALNNSGQSEIVQLRANGRTIAANLAVHHNNTYYSLKGGFDPSFSHFSPMHLLDAESMRHSFEDLGCEIYDYGLGSYAYKFDWNPSVGINYYCCIGEGGYYAKSVAAIYRTLWRRLLTVSYQNKEQARADN